MTFARGGRAPLVALLLLSLAVRAAASNEPLVLMISLDGTGPEAVRRARMPALEDLMLRGATAERLVPVFPTNTFPNHVTLVTGVAPERHGIVNNVFWDPARGLHRYSDDPSWIEVEPLWSLVARHGVVSAAYHWVGSEGAWRSGSGPRHWKRFDGSVRERVKVAQILAWLDLEAPAERPRLVTSWFRGADAAGHRHGPASREVAEALREQDAALAELVRGIDERRLWDRLTLLIVSDHGMESVARTVDLQAALDAEGIDARVLGGGGFATLRVREAELGVARSVAAARRLGLEAYARQRAPASWRVGHRRFGEVVVLAPPGTAIARGGGSGSGLLRRIGLAWLARRLAGPDAGGAHGYPPETPSMGALFVAAGRGVAPGRRIDRVRAVDVAPTVLALLELPIPEWMEGRPIALGSEASAAVGERREDRKWDGASRPGS